MNTTGMAQKRKSKRTSKTSNKKSRVENDEGTLTDQQYETLYKYYCEYWTQKMLNLVVVH